MKRRKQYITLTCDYCGKQFEVPPWKAKRGTTGKKYCSHKCYGLGQKKRIEKQCRYCGKSFEVIPSSKNKQHYCSKDCRLADGWTQSDPAKRSIFICDWCGEEFEEWTYRHPRFCSAQCRSEYAARQPKPSARKPQIHITRICEYCGKEYETTTHQVRLRGSRFCSQECNYNQMSIDRMGKDNPNYNGGHVDNYGPHWLRQKRRAVRRDNHTCQVCGYQSGGDTILDVHHITPIKEFAGNYRKANVLKNLICLCRKCHVKVERDDIPCPIPSA